MYRPIGVYADGFNSKPDVLAVLSVDGEINDGMAKTLSDQIDKINDNARVKAVLIKLNTPGGEVTASEEIREKFDTLKVPAVAWCDAECASGGIYILQSKNIKYVGMTNYTVAGAVGVFSTVQHYNRLLDWAKIDTKIYKSAPLKDAGDPTQPSDAAQDAYMQSIVDSLAHQFYDLVLTHRHITNAKELESAKIFIGQDAVKLGLADAIITSDEAELKAKQLSGSKQIYTNQELKKMAKAAANDGNDTDGDYKLNPAIMPNAQLTWAITQLKNILSQETVQFKYELPYKF